MEESISAILGKKNLRALAIVAHPDDEVIGIGTLLPSLSRSIIVVYATDGQLLVEDVATRFSDSVVYGEARIAEGRAALGLAGIAPRQISRFGMPDMGLCGYLIPLARRIERLLRELRPHLIFTHAYEGGHPDHDSVSYAVNVARAASPKACVLEFASYHAKGEALETEAFLPFGDSEIWTRALTPPQRTLKRRMMAAFKTQLTFLKEFPLDRELLRRVPRYDFSKAPHPGRLFYERMGWLSGSTWRRQARGALAELGLQKL